ncbi:MAG: hypothetical protein PHV88_07205, partial [Eubacteriales bacterium]|nr:hypothetical protein [Eubacteriales bacterium]
MNKSLIKKALAICVSMALLVSGLIAANVFSAGDTSFFNFEDGLHGWTGSARSSMGQQFGSAEISQYTAADETDPLVKAGTKSLKVDMTTYPVDEVDTKEDYAFRINITKDGTVNGVPLVAGQKFTFNFFFPTGSTLRMIQIGHTGTPNYISSTAGLTIVKGSWFSVVDYTVPGDRSLTEFYITLVGNAGINETAYIDSVTMAVPATPTVDPSIPVNLVAGMNGQGIRAVAGDSSNVSDLTFGSEGTMPLTRLTNGNQTDHIDIYGGLNDVDHPGVRYDLGAVYSLSEVNFFGATGDTITPLGVDIYASTSSGDLFAEGNRIYTTTDNNVAKKGLVLTSAKSARYVAFLMTQKGDVGGYRPAEFEVFGEQSITVPNILAGNAGQGFRAVQGDIANISDLTFGSEGTMPLTRLTNENQTDHIDIYGGLNEADDPGVHYDLVAVYTLTEINFFGATGSTITPLGADIYASETYEDLFTAGNRVLSVSSDNNAKKGITFTSPINARYVAFIMTDVAELGGYRPAEFEVFGVPQGSPLPTAAPTAVPTAVPTA